MKKINFSSSKYNTPITATGLYGNLILSTENYVNKNPFICLPL